MRPSPPVTVAVLAVALLLGLFVYQRTVVGKRLVVSTTTSLYETGLLQALGEEYERVSGTRIDFIPLGTGQALEFAKRGDADGTVVHAPSLEEEFLRENHGVGRRIFAYNFFALVGPPADPAGAKGENVLAALQKIAEAGRTGKVKWISRADNSGTHVKELKLWQLAGVQPAGEWYIETGSGMSSTLRVASEMSAYTLTDLGTYLSLYQRGQLKLDIMVGEDRDLLNIYSAIAVKKSRRLDQMLDFIRFLTSERAQRLISEFQGGLFHPAVTALQENENSTLSEWIREAGFIPFENTLWECPPPYQA
jgi:tungstate transport system substrate-binding protein